MHEHLRRERVERRQRGRFDDGRIPAEERRQHDHRQQHFPLALPERGEHVTSPEGRARNALLQGLTHAPGRGERHQQETGQDAADEQVLDPRLRDDGVEDQGQGGRQQQAERSRRGDESQRKALAIAVAHERRKQQPAQRENGHARSAREHGEERREERAHDRRAAPAQPNSARKTRSIRSGACPSASRKPARVNSGIDGSVGLTASE